MLRRGGPVLAGVIVAVGLLAACSGSDGGSTANPPTTAPTAPATTAPAASPSTTTTTPDTTEPTAPVDDFSTRDPFQPVG